MEQNRFKSWALWVSTAGAVYIILTGVMGLEIDAGVWNTVLDAIGSILIAFGLVNNPTNKMGL